MLLFSRLAWLGKCSHHPVPGQVLGQGIVQAPARPGPGTEEPLAPSGLVASRAGASALCFLIWRGILKPGWDLQHKGI